MRSLPSSKRRQAGLGLLEVLLAITISLVVGAIAADQLRSNNETKQAAAAGDQLKLVGNAFNTYVALRYDKLVSLNSVGSSCSDINGTTSGSQGLADDPGPRCCDPATKFCVITSDTLRHNGLLPNSFSGYNSYGATYKYLIRVQGAAPNFVVDGMVFTDVPYTTTGATPRYDLLGVAMQEAGADSGMTRSVANRMEGLNGAWNEANYTTPQVPGAWPNVDTLGLLGYRVGYGTSGYAAYLRLDGSSAMTGPLDMGNNGIANVSQLRLNGPTAAGASVLNISANAASGATGTDITDAGINGGLVVRNDNGLTVTNLAGTTQGNIKAGVGTFGPGPVGSPTTITANGLTGLLTAPTINAGAITVNNGNVLVKGGYGVVFDPKNTGTGAGGWFMDAADMNWVQSVNGVGILTSGEVRGTNVSALDRIYVGEIRGANVGVACSDTPDLGASVGIPITKSSDANELVQCRNGFWSPLGVTTFRVVGGTTTGVAGSTAAAACPANTTLTGGGYVLTSYAVNGGGVGANSPDQSYPSGNSWAIMGSSISASRFQAYALCAN